MGVAGDVAALVQTVSEWLLGVAGAAASASSDMDF